MVGGTGELGAYVVRRLITAGHLCTVYSRTQRSHYLADVADRTELVAGDVGDFSRLNRVIADGGFETICHLAADLGQREAGPAAMFSANAIGTMNVLEAAAKADTKRVVYASSSMVYGRADGDHGYPTYRPFEERVDWPDPSSCHTPLYGVSKLAGEHLCLAFYRQFGLESIALRLAPSLCVGSDEGHPALRVHRRMIEAAATSTFVSIAKGSDEKMDVVDGRDVARAFELACMAPYHPDAAVLNVGSGRGRTLIEWSEAIRQETGETRIEIGPGLDFLDLSGNYRVLDVALAREVLGYEPTTDLREVVRGYLNVKRLLGMDNESARSREKARKDRNLAG